MSETLKPCPFCGGEAEAKYLVDVGAFARCKVCFAEGFFEHDLQTTIEKWNTRADSDAIREACEIIKELWRALAPQETWPNREASDARARAFLARHAPKVKEQG